MTYTLSEVDRNILYNLGEENANHITDYYLRNDVSGTWWESTSSDEDKVAGYWTIHKLWKRAGKPSGKLLVETEAGRVTYHVKGHDHKGNPVFHHHHGFLMMPWQLRIHHAPQHTVIVAGGYGTGKTVGLSVSMLVNAVRNREFAGAIVAPYSNQSKEAYSRLETLLRGSLFKERFVKKMVISPIPTIILAHDGIGESSIRFYPVLDDPQKMKSLELDQAAVDQAEMFLNLRQDIFEILGSRTRGMIAGRERLGKLGLYANSADNPEFWDAYDDAEFDDDTLAITVTTYENPFITSSEKKRMEKRVGGTQDTIDVHMRAQRPRGKGKHFPSSSIDACHSRHLENVNQEGVNQGMPHFEKLEAPKVGLYKWEIPPLHGAKHLVMADPGWDNPPYRNSPVIMVWDITRFPQKPASLRYFHWIFAGGSPTPFTDDYIKTVKKYRADQIDFPGDPDAETLSEFELQEGYNGLDSTGWQSMYDHFVWSEVGIVPERVSMSGNNKYMALNSAKLLLPKGLFEFPYIPHLWLQLLKYDQPDTKLRQDLVMTISMSALWLMGRYGAEIELMEADPVQKPQFFVMGRYARHNESRYANRTKTPRPAV